MAIKRSSPPADPEGHLWLLTADGWSDLGAAELAEGRNSNALEFKGSLQLPPALQNRAVWLAYHEAIYRCVWLSNVDVEGKTTLHIKVERTHTANEWPELTGALAESPDPSAELRRYELVGDQYPGERRMFAGRHGRLV